MYSSSSSESTSGYNMYPHSANIGWQSASGNLYASAPAAAMGQMQQLKQQQMGAMAPRNVLVIQQSPQTASAGMRSVCVRCLRLFVMRACACARALVRVTGVCLSPLRMREHVHYLILTSFMYIYERA